MIRLRSLAQLDLFRLDEISHVRTLGDFALRTQMRIRPNNRSRSDFRLLHNATGPDHHAVANIGVANHAVRPHSATAANLRLSEQLHIRLDHGVRRNFHIRINDASLGIKNGHPIAHQLPAFRYPHLLVDGRQFRARIPAQHLVRSRRRKRDHSFAQPAQHLRHVGQVILGVGIVRR